LANECTKTRSRTEMRRDNFSGKFSEVNEKKTFFSPKWETKPRVVWTAPTPDGAKTRRLHRIGRPLRVERSTPPSRTTWCEPCQTATTWRWSVKWKEREKGQRALHRPDCSHSGRGKNLQSEPNSGGLCEEKGQIDHQEQRGVDRGRR
jgi:hypothetical protein